MRATALVDDVLHRLRPQVEGGHGRADDAAHLGHGRHVAQVDQVQRRLAHHQHQPAPLLEHDVGRARDQVVAQAAGDRRQRAHRTGRDGHAGGAEAAAGDGPRRRRRPRARGPPGDAGRPGPWPVRGAGCASRPRTRPGATRSPARRAAPAACARRRRRRSPPRSRRRCACGPAARSGPWPGAPRAAAWRCRLRPKRLRCSSTGSSSASSVFFTTRPSSVSPSIISRRLKNRVRILFGAPCAKVGTARADRQVGLGLPRQRREARRSGEVEGQARVAHVDAELAPLHQLRHVGRQVRRRPALSTVDSSSDPGKAGSVPAARPASAGTRDARGTSGMRGLAHLLQAGAAVPVAVAVLARQQRAQLLLRLRARQSPLRAPSNSRMACAMSRDCGLRRSTSTPAVTSSHRSCSRLHARRLGLDAVEHQKGLVLACAGAGRPGGRCS